MTSADKKFVFGDAGNCIAFGFGLGLAPKMPGTAGTLAAFPLYWIFCESPARWAVFVLLFGAGVYLCGRACAMLKKHDDSGIVLDEIAAFYAVLLLTPAETEWQAAAFILFRIFDATKPPPIGWLDKNMHGGFGVMIDDIAAAALTLAVLSAIKYAL